MQFVDANIFLRHLTNDQPTKAQACSALLYQAHRKEIRLTTSESVIAEVVYVLSSTRQPYQLSPEDIRARLRPLLSLPGLMLPHRKVFLRALDVYAAYPLDFEDALSIAQMERQHMADIFSFDRGLDLVPTVQGLEP